MQEKQQPFINLSLDDTIIDERDGLMSEIRIVKQQRNAVILAHNYEIGDVQDVADIVGDSLALSQAAATSDADIIVFCGVHFMAETAAILAPDKTVLIPAAHAGCSLAASISVEQLRAWKAEHPDAVVVSYINTTADIKAESDYCCTSGNAVKVVQAIPAGREILFLPDQFLGNYVAHKTGRHIHIWQGQCHVHDAITADMLASAHRAHPTADFIIHPESRCVTSCMERVARGDNNGNEYILSTEGMMRHVAQSNAREFVVATEVGMLHRLQQTYPSKQFYPISKLAICDYMKMTTLRNVYVSLRNMQHRVTVDPAIAERARLPVERMLALA